jgi:hypothetical protein
MSPQLLTALWYLIALPATLLQTAAFLHRAAAAQRFGTIFASQEAFDEGSKEVPTTQS